VAGFCLARKAASRDRLAGHPAWSSARYVTATTTARKPFAVSPAGAQGIAQLMPGTTAAYGLDHHISRISIPFGSSGFRLDHPLLGAIKTHLRLQIGVVGTQDLEDPKTGSSRKYGWYDLPGDEAWTKHLGGSSESHFSSSRN
jgi:hypothetical protein